MPPGVQVRLSVYAPPHPLLERVIELEPDAAEKRVDLTLAARVPMRSLGVIVNLPPGAPSPEWMVPARKIVVVKESGARVAGRKGAWVTLNPERGARVELHVVSPDASATRPKLEPLDSPAADGRLVIGQRSAGDEQQLVRARLERTDGEGIYDLNRGLACSGHTAPRGPTWGRSWSAPRRSTALGGGPSGPIERFAVLFSLNPAGSLSSTGGAGPLGAYREWTRGTSFLTPTFVDP